MMKRITLALSLAVGLLCTSQAQVMMLFSQDSLTGIVSPLDVDSLFYWFAADVGVTDSLGGAIATDEGVGTWNDLSGNGYHVTQSTDGARPVWKATGGPGSKPCIQFDGTDDFLASAAHWWGSDDLTVFVVMKFGNATRDAAELILSRFETVSPVNNRQWLLAATGTATSYRIAFGTSISGTAYDGEMLSTNGKSTSWQLWTALLNGTDAMWIDGASETLSSSTATSIYNSSSVKFGVGARNVTSGTINGPMQGSISEIIVYTRALTATERTAIELYLNRKYDLY